MPTYEFRCPDGHEFEKFYRTISTAESQAVCPTCGLPAERMMSATGFAFKGSGFYLTDYGKNAHRGEAPPSKGGDASVTSAAESAKSDNGAGDAKGATDKKEPAKSSDAPSTASETKKAEPKTAEAKPAAAPSKPSASE